MSHDAQIHLAAMWCDQFDHESDAELSRRLSWASVAFSNGVGGLVKRMLIVERGRALMPVLFEVAGMPLADGEEILAYRQCMTHIRSFLADRTDHLLRAERARELVRASAVVVAAMVPDAAFAWAQAPTLESSLHGSAFRSMTWRGWTHDCAMRPLHHVEGMRDAGAAKVRIGPVMHRLQGEAIATAASDPMAVMRAHAVVEDLCA